jgi:hypothetical protein
MVHDGNKFRLYIVRNGQNMAIHHLIPVEALQELGLVLLPNGLVFLERVPEYPDLWLGNQLGRVIYDCEFTIAKL